MKIKKYLSEAKGKGFTITCNKCGEFGSFTGKKTEVGKISIETISREHGGGSYGVCVIYCFKCHNELRFEE